jgi:ATP-dependent DNA helicase RecG
LKGVGPVRGDLLKKEKEIFTFGDLLEDFPFRYIDKTTISSIGQLRQTDHEVLLRGRLTSLRSSGKGRGKRLNGILEDHSGKIELVWFQGASYLEKALTTQSEYLVFGKIKYHRGRKSMAHPEMEKIQAQANKKQLSLSPVYSSTEKLAGRGFTIRAQRNLVRTVIDNLKPSDIQESLPSYLLERLKLCSRLEAYKWIHFPFNQSQLKAARNRLKFEELFFFQLSLWLRYEQRKKSISYNFEKVGKHFNHFYESILPFNLTNAQKKVIKEIRRDLGSGHQMNRLLQGDVGSGKTVVALMSMLIAIDNGFQSCIMAPTEILAQQHYEGISELLEKTDVKTALLTGSIKGKARKQILDALKEGYLNIIIGTHALIEDPVVFKQLGLSITDEQHRFGVAQRAKLWNKAKPHPPHILVMTATPIPRTLAMTVFGDLDVSIIDELPPGRKPIKTLHIKDKDRLRMYKFIKKEIALGRQVYIVFPLIEESEKLDLANLEEGYEYLLTHFPRPEFQMSIVHGRMKSVDKEAEMKRFVEGKTQILVATTVIEVGVNVPNASVMLIENAERFGLSQIHQLRGRVGRGADQSYCLLLSKSNLSKEAQERMQIMCSTNDGFKIAEADLRLRGPGQVEGTRQSGDLGLKIASPVYDQEILKTARHMARLVIQDDPKLEKSINRPLNHYMRVVGSKTRKWSKIS